jgi:hypothetical protein
MQTYEQPDHNHHFSHEENIAQHDGTAPTDESVEALVQHDHHDSFLSSSHTDVVSVGYEIENASPHDFISLNTLPYQGRYDFADTSPHDHSTSGTLPHKGRYDFAGELTPYPRSAINPSTRSVYHEQDTIIYKDEHGDRHQGLILHKSYSTSSHCDEYEVQRADTSRTVDTIGLADIQGVV